MTAREKIQAEYNKCIAFWKHPEDAPKLSGVEGREATRKYYEYRAEALGFALDAFAQEDRGVL